MNLIKPTQFTAHYDIALAISDALGERKVETLPDYIRFSAARKDMITKLRELFHYGIPNFVKHGSLTQYDGKIEYYQSLADVLADMGEELIVAKPFDTKLNFEATLQLMRAVNQLHLTRINCSSDYTEYNAANSAGTFSKALSGAVAYVAPKTQSTNRYANYRSYVAGNCERDNLCYAYIEQAADMSVRDERFSGYGFLIKIAPKNNAAGASEAISHFMPIGRIHEVGLMAYSTDIYQSGTRYRLNLMSSGPDIPSWLYEQQFEVGEVKSWGYYPEAVADFRCDNGFTFFDLS